MTTNRSESTLQQLNQELAEANQQLEDYSQTLEQKVTARTAELKIAQERILSQEKLASLGTLTAGVAHELRNPLNFVKNYAEGSVELSQDLLDSLHPIFQSLSSERSDEAQDLIADLKENAAAICRHSQRAEQIIESMMQHTYMDQRQTAPQETRLPELLDRAIKLAYHSKRSRQSDFNLSIRIDYDADADVIKGLPSNLMRALINLIDNAFDAMRFKQRQLQANNPQAAADYTPILSIATHSFGEEVEIRIRDNGCGVDPAIQGAILDPFFTTKPPGEGTGLGLSLTHDIIVKQHQGELTLETQQGEFTEFVITLPQG